ncbi:hypothetical protein [Ectobacillus ponti]|uniref:DUF1453 domain-containing protein n=1 Tax=Ectobacillus ponti TaxID=2961894 RepID=A0AA41X294_9BACI|nr:hypothetical protein [Ectobacillus ponti]MCP8967604.1 hypothetical protein [Ectobacillus ponti]
MNQQVYSIAILALLIGFLIYRRVRRNIGWQLLSPRKLRVRTIIFLLIGLMFLSSGLLHPVSLVSDVAGIVIGGALAYYGMGLTSYQTNGGRRYYKPNTWIGSAVIVLFLGRLAYRFYRMYSMGLFDGSGPSAYAAGNMNEMNFGTGTLWSSGFLMIMFAYYAVYYILLLRKEKSAEAVRV